MRMGRIIVLSLVLVCCFFEMASALTIFKDSFDDNNGLAGWKPNNTTYITRYTGSYKVGTASLQINGPYEIIAYLNTGPFYNQVLTFKLAGVSFNASDKFEAFCDYGIGYVCIGTLYYANANGTFKSFSYNVPQGYRSFKIKFKLTTSGTGHYGYVDDVLLTGTW